MQLQIDVLICGYNEAPHVPRLLDSLRAQSVGAESFRVLFLDNASTDGTEAVVREHGRDLNLEYVREERLGKNFAVNSGYERARAPYVAHIDADAQAAPDWLATIEEVVLAEDPDLCGGPYFPYYAGPKPAWFHDRYNSNDLGDQPHYLRGNEHLTGTNMVWRRSVVEQLGGFRSGIGMKGRGHARGDETEMMLRAKEQLPHFKAFYDPRIIVYHLTRPETLSLWYWVRRSFVEGHRRREVWGDTADATPLSRVLSQLAAQWAVAVGRTGRALVVRDRTAYPHWQNYVWERLLPDYYNLGQLWSSIRPPRQR